MRHICMWYVVLCGIAAAAASSGQSGSGFRSYRKADLDRVVVSNYAAYLVPFSSGRPIVRLEEDGTQSPWEPMLPEYSQISAVYPGQQNPWVSYLADGRDYRFVVAEAPPGAEPVRTLWQGGDLVFSTFAVSTSERIYAMGHGRGLLQRIALAKNGDTVSEPLVHIIEPKTGQQRHLWPLILDNSPENGGRVSSLLVDGSIAVKSNENFFVSFDPLLLISYGWEDRVARQALEYSSDGNIAKVWDVGIADQNSFIRKIFVDVDDSVLAEVLSLRSLRTGTRVGGPIREHYLVRIDSRRELRRCDLPFDEYLLGWMGQSREIVTQSNNREEVRIRKVPL